MKNLSEMHQDHANTIIRDLRRKLRRASELLDEVHVSQRDYMDKLEESSLLLYGTRPLFGSLKQTMQQAGAALESEQGEGEGERK